MPLELNREQRTWLDNVYRAYNQQVFRTCQRFSCGDRAWALDRMHDVFVTAAERADELKAMPDPGGWLYRVAVNACFMSMRRQRTWRRLLPRFSQEGVAPAPEAQVAARRTLTAVERALAELPPKQRAVVVLVHLLGNSQTDAAELLDLSKGQVSKLHRRAVNTLRTTGWDVADA